MKTYKATFWRGNPQLANGGYEVTRTIEGPTEAYARATANTMAKNTCYGTLTLRKIELVNE